MPRLLEELADMSDGYIRVVDGKTERVTGDAPGARDAAAVLRRLREVVGRNGVQVVLAPYADPDLPTLVEEVGIEAVNRHVSVARDVLASVLGRDPGADWLVASGGRLDAGTLEELRLAGVARMTVVDPDSLATSLAPEDVQCPELSPTFACAVRLQTSAGSTKALVIDEGIAQRWAALERTDDARLGLQNLFAETAMVHAELPGTPGRALHIPIPTLWQPGAREWNLLMKALARAPWLQTTRPDQVLRPQLPVIRAEVAPRAPALDAGPPLGLFDDVEDAADLIDHFEDLGAPSRIVARLDTNLLVAESRMWWADAELEEEGEEFIDETDEEIAEYFDAVSIGGPEEITLTSRRGKVQLVVFNNGDFPVDVVLELTSDHARLEPSTLDLEIPEGTQRQLDIDAIAQSSGIFTLNAEVTTADGLEITTKQIRVRSTSFNLIALGLTLGALMFLIGFYVTRAFRRGKPAATT